MERRQTIMRAMASARCAWRNHVKQAALSEGIPDSYRPVILYLHRHPGAGQKSIAEFAGVTTSAVNQVVKSLEEEGYLCKQTDPSDKRYSKIYLTDKGEGVASRLFARLSASDDAITALLGEEKERELIALMAELGRYIREELDGC